MGYNAFWVARDGYGVRVFKAEPRWVKSAHRWPIPRHDNFVPALLRKFLAWTKECLPNNSKALVNVHWDWPGVTLSLSGDIIDRKGGVYEYV